MKLWREVRAFPKQRHWSSGERVYTHATEGKGNLFGRDSAPPKHWALSIR